MTKRSNNRLPLAAIPTLCLLALAGLVGCSTGRGPSAPTEFRVVAVEEGIASFYGRTKWSTEPTASGERFRASQMTAAHRRLPFQTWVRVTNLRNGRSVIVRINDRGPFIKGRIIDLSRGAAERIGMIQRGIAPVRVEVLAIPRPRGKKR